MADKIAKLADEFREKYAYPKEDAPGAPLPEDTKWIIGGNSRVYLSQEKAKNDAIKLNDFARKNGILLEKDHGFGASVYYG